MAKFPNRLPALLTERKMKQADLVRALKERGYEFPKQTINKIFRGETQLSKEWALRFEPILKMPWHEIMASPEDVESMAHQPVEKTIDFDGEAYAAVAVFDAHASAGPGALNSDHPEPMGYRIFPVEWLRALSRSAAAALAILMVAGDSMEPTLQNGDHIMIDTGVRHLGRDGLYVIAAENEVQVKRLSRDPRDRSVTIRSDNPKAESWTGVPEDQVHVLGRVLWLSRRVEG